MLLLLLKKEPTVLNMLRAKSAPVDKLKRLSSAGVLRQSVIDMPMISTTMDVKYKYYKDTVFKLV